ncbi:MAG: ATP-binding protein [Arcicella sp.]|nr:ATP-binding protein [Arcicella sp.]
MIGRDLQLNQLNEALNSSKSSFIAVTGRRRVGKTFLIDEIYKKNICLRITGIQGEDLKAQIVNFTEKISEYSNKPIFTVPNNWQETFLHLKSYLKILSKNKKQVIFLDELPWMNTSKSGFIQLLAHLWNDFLSKESHFILVVCGSSTSWINQKIVNDKGGFHNRLTHHIKLSPFTLSETKQFLLSKNIKQTDSSISELYMVMGGIPFYLENIKQGESPTVSIERMCFLDGGILKNEYDNLYKAIFESSANHESIVEVLASSKQGLTREEIITKTKINSVGSYQRAVEELLISGFIVQEYPFGKKKRGSIYRLVDEFSVFYHKFIKQNQKAKIGIWQILSNSQSYKIWSGYAFESLCMKHIYEIKKAMGVQNVYTETSSYRHVGNKTEDGFQLDLIIDRKDAVINLCECKFYDSTFEITKKYASQLKSRKSAFRTATNTKKNIFITLISNHPIKENEYSLESVDVRINVSDLIN